MFNWFKEAAIKKGMSNIRDDTEKLIEAANAAESRVSLTGYMHAMDQEKIKRLQNNLARNIRWAISVEVPTSTIMAQIESVVIRMQISKNAEEAIDYVGKNIFIK